MYLVLSALTSSPVSLVAATNASAFSFRVCMLPASILTCRHKPAADVYQENQNKERQLKIGCERMLIHEKRKKSKECAVC